MIDTINREFDSTISTEIPNDFSSPYNTADSLEDKVALLADKINEVITELTDLLVKDLDKQTEVTSDGQSGELEGKTGPLQTYNDPREKKSP